MLTYVYTDIHIYTCNCVYISLYLYTFFIHAFRNVYEYVCVFLYTWYMCIQGRLRDCSMATLSLQGGSSSQHCPVSVWKPPSRPKKPVSLRFLGQEPRRFATPKHPPKEKKQIYICMCIYTHADLFVSTYTYYSCVYIYICCMYCCLSIGLFLPQW